jgi:gamma-glutamyltranspeptidase/glutathione hydrolase
MNFPTIPSPKQSSGNKFVVSSGHRLASLEALKVMQNGGNVVDAAIAGAAVLSVVLPYACGLGGDMYVLIREGSSGKIHGINGTGCSPRAATNDKFLEGIPRRGVKSATVPGMVKGWEDVLLRFGSVELKTLLQPAIKYAENGFNAHSTYISNTKANLDLLRENDYASDIFIPDNKPHPLKAKVRQPALANTLNVIAENGVDEFYNGEIAYKIVHNLEIYGGLLQLQDFSEHETLWQNPISANFCGYDIFTMPPNSWGITLPLQLIELANNNITECDPSSPEFMMKGYLARQAAYRSVANHIGDPRLTETSAIEILNRKISESPNMNYTATEKLQEAGGSDTSNIVVADIFGNAVSLIQSISTPYGSGIVAGDTGVLMNNRMQGFTNNIESRNCVGPSKRPAHTLAPALVLRNDDLYMSLGTPGAPGQTCSMAQFLARVLGCGEDIYTAVAAPRWSVNFKGEPIVENAVNKEFLKNLNIKNQRFESEKTGWITFGSIKAVVSNKGKLSGVADGRRVADTLSY